MQVYEWMVLTALQFGKCVLGTSSSKLAKRNFERHNRERVPLHSHADTCISESIDHVPPNIPDSSHSAQLCIFEDTAAVIQMIREG